MEERGLRKTRIGVVVSDKMDKTCVIQIKTRVRHPLYGKIMNRTSNPKLCAMLDNQLEGSSKVFAFMAVKVLAEAALALLALAAVEYMAERVLHAESLRMSRREVLEEMKQESGDPVVKDILRREYEKQ